MSKTVQWNTSEANAAIESFGQAARARHIDLAYSKVTRSDAYRQTQTTLERISPNLEPELFLTRLRTLWLVHDALLSYVVDHDTAPRLMLCQVDPLTGEDIYPSDVTAGVFDTSRQMYVPEHESFNIHQLHWLGSQALQFAELGLRPFNAPTQ